MKSIKIRTGAVELNFASEGGGFPTECRISEFGNETTLLMQSPIPMLSMKYGESLIMPKLNPSCPVRKYRRNGAQILEFSRIPWFNPSTSEPVKDLFLALTWEFFPGGVIFCDMFLYYANLNIPPIQDFRLSIPVDFSNFDDLKWAVCRFPQDVDGTVIQTAWPERFIHRSESRFFENELFTSVNMNAVREHGPSLFTEFFLENNNSLFNRDLRHTTSAVRMDNGSCRLEWNFQNIAASVVGRPLHWRNRWGFLIKPAVRSRRHAPLHMYHYLDNFQRYPDDEQLQQISATGAKVLILHDSWRFDTQNGGIPYDEMRFQHLVEQVRQLGMRLVLYIRGNEENVRQTASAWFSNWLRKNVDGLYIDYGGPLGFWSAPTENFPGGTIAYREYYESMRALRQQVGPQGLLFSHTGPGYSGIAMSFFDTYVSGEGERGILVKSRREHEYFSMAPVAPGSMWVAAFPEYTSPLMPPFLAATGQAPHLPLGVQIKSSSLAHPQVPGINDTNFHELLYLWSLIEPSSKYDFFTDYNSAGVFDPADDRNVGHYLILSQETKSGLMFIANLSDSPRQAAFNFASDRISADRSAYKIFPIPGQPSPEPAIQLAPYEFAAALVTTNQKHADRLIENHPRPRHTKTSKLTQEYENEVAVQKEYRVNFIPATECRLQVRMPTRITSHEQSLWEDLYNVEILLRLVIDDQQYEDLGYVSKNGLEKDPPAKSSQLHPGEVSAKIDLHRLLGEGKHELQLYSQQNGAPFYSFLIAKLIVDKQARKIIRFMNQVENDRAILHWKVKVLHPKS